MESSDGETEDLEEKELDVLDIEDDNNKDSEDSEIDDEGAEVSEKEINSDGNEDEVPEKKVNISLSFSLLLDISYIGLGLQKVEQISRHKGFYIEVFESSSTSASASGNAE